MADELEITEAHLALLRKAVVSWSLTEAGAPTVEPAAPYGSDELLDDVAGVLGIQKARGGSYHRDDVERLRSLHRETGTAFEILLELGEIEPGTHQIDDGVAFLDVTGQLSMGTIDVRASREEPELSDRKWLFVAQVVRDVWRARRKAVAAIKAGVQPISFELRPEHLALLRAMAVRWEDNDEPPTVVGEDPVAAKLEELLDEETLFPVPAIDPKRPYGMRTDHVIDMAEILGVELVEGSDGDPDLPEDERERLTALHEETQTALQVVLARATLRPGRYRRGGEGGWERVDGS